MTYWQAIVLAGVEGLTEFLPVSSTAHLTVASWILGLPQTAFVKTFEIAIQSGAMLAVVVYYLQVARKRVGLIKKIGAAFVPAMIAGVVFYQFIKSYLLGNYWVTAAALVAGGWVLIFVREKKQAFDDLSYKQAIMVGLGQCLAMIPGISRAGAVIVTGMMLGQSQVAATEFSFLLAVPTVLAATVWDLFKSAPVIRDGDMGVLGLGFVGSAGASFAVVNFFIAFVKKHSLASFGVYRIILGVLMLAYLVL